MQTLNLIPQQNLKYILIIFFLLSVVFLGYFTERSNTWQVYSLFSAMFFIYWQLIKQNIGISFIIISAILLRAIQLFMLPNLSDDYFRFIWDGILLQNGINPFYYLPSYFIGQEALPQNLSLALYQQLNSPEYFTIYPPVCQFTFWVSSFFIGDDFIGPVVVMRLFLLSAEIGTLIVLKNLLEKLNIGIANIKWYAFNPLVIIEITGNLHYEGLMIFFLVCSLYLLQKNRLILAALMFALSVASKLLPLMFLPLLFFFIGWKQAIKFYIICGIGLLILFIGFLDLEMISNMGESVNLYFKRFEFNASIYYVVRWIGYQVKGYNIIEIAGIRLAYIPIFLILIFSIIKTKNLKGFTIKTLFILSVYFFTATIIHPWYITSLVLLCSFTKYRFAIIWSGFAILSYATYRDSSYQEVPLFLYIEYLMVYGFMFWELYKDIVSGEIQLQANYFFKSIKKPPI